jgi:N4-gp56 family major capsid protein
MVAITNLNSLTSEQRTFYDNLLLDRALPQLEMAQWAVRKPIPANMGKSINFRRFELIDASAAAPSALTEGTSGEPSSPSISNVTATVSQYGRWMRATDVLDDASVDPLLTEFTSVFGEQAGIDMDCVIRDVLVAGTAVQYASTAASRGQVGSAMYISSAELREAVRTLQRNNARPIPSAGGKYICIIHPDTWADLLNDTDAKNAFQYAAPRDASNPLFSGDTWDYLGVRFVVTSNANIKASLGLSGADVYQSVFLGNQAYAVSDLDPQSLRIYYKSRESGGPNNPLDMVWSLGYKCAFAVTRLNENFMLRLEHVTSAKNAA